MSFGELKEGDEFTFVRPVALTVVNRFEPFGFVPPRVSVKITMSDGSTEYAVWSADTWAKVVHKLRTKKVSKTCFF